MFITGHTGFKGSWLTKILDIAGAFVTGYSLAKREDVNLFDLLTLSNRVTTIEGDIRNLSELTKAMQESEPEIVMHLAAQPLVRESYENPHYTYETNVMGTVNVLECVRSCPSVKSVLNVTTDKVYRNFEWDWGYRETDVLNGYDPYSNSKSCSELVTSSYIKSFFNNSDVRISTARAGNVIGGGDFAKDRIIPDCVRAAIEGEYIKIRNPHSIRPYQHVLEPLKCYLMIVENQMHEQKFQGEFNIGPNDKDCVPTGVLATLFCQAWGNKLEWTNQYVDGPHEANFLKLDCSKFKNRYRWSPKWDIESAVNKTVEFSKAYANGEDINKVMKYQIQEFFE